LQRAHARELEKSIPLIAGVDAVLGTEGRSPVEVAEEVRDLLRSHSVLPGPPPA
jgi:hypothetical protein